MPREQRKRGLRHKKTQASALPPPSEPQSVFDATEQPSWIIDNPEPNANDDEFPFGIVDPDVKAYFRMVDGKIREWQSGREERDDMDDVQETDHSRRLFLTAALSELSGKELQIAADPEGSVMLERMLYSMDDFSRRVFFDRLAGERFIKLSCHRFASHVCQTLLVTAAQTISRECKGFKPALPEDGTGLGVLPTMVELVTAAYEELLQHVSTLITDPFGSHVVRALVGVLAGHLLRPSHSGTADLRSKKSAKYRAQQGSMTSILQEFDNSHNSRETPVEFRDMAVRLVHTLNDQLDANQIRALASHKAANPVIQMVIELEAKTGNSDQPGSIMDSMLVGMISDCHNSPPKECQASEYIETVLRDAVASHILDAILLDAPQHILTRIWSTYLKGKLTKLAVHPVTNFAISRAVSRLDSATLKEMMAELKGKWPNLLKHSRTATLRAAVNRAAELNEAAAEALTAVRSAFDFSSQEDDIFLVPSVLSLKPLPVYRGDVNSTPLATSKGSQGVSNSSDMPAPAAHHGKAPGRDFQSLPTLQGSLILQAMLRLPQPFNQVVIDSISAMTMDERLSLAHDPTSSRVIDALLESPTVPPRAKRTFISSILGHYHLLVDDKFGSRIGDSCWAKADTFLKEKIALSLVKQETFLAASHFGRFFARKLRLTLLQRRPEEWKSLQSNEVHSAQHLAEASGKPRWALDSGKTSSQHFALNPTNSLLPAGVLAGKKRKAPKDESDDIDALFKSAPKKRQNPVEIATIDVAGNESNEGAPSAKQWFNIDPKGDRSLAEVLGVIENTRDGAELEKPTKKPKRAKR